MHVLLVAESEEALKAADEVIGKIVNDPEHAANLKRQQLRSVRALPPVDGEWPTAGVSLTPCLLLSPLRSWRW